MSSKSGIIQIMKYKILREFGKRVKGLRKKRGWSQEELGKKTGLHRTYIGSIERSERNVSLINVKRIADALGVRAKDLIG